VGTSSCSNVKVLRYIFRAAGSVDAKTADGSRSESRAGTKLSPLSQTTTTLKQRKVSEFVCRDCRTIVALPVSYSPEFKRRVVNIAISEDGESDWDKQARHLCVTDSDPYGPSATFAQCRIGKGHPQAGQHLSLALIQREVAAQR
jgi:hypothetical protein